jgi:SlyX protein
MGKAGCKKHGSVRISFSSSGTVSGTLFPFPIAGTSGLDRRGADMKERITDIEIQLMHHENTIQQLNEVVTRQQFAIEELRAAFGQMMQQLRKLYPSDVRDPLEEEPPPHY